MVNQNNGTAKYALLLVVLLNTFRFGNAQVTDTLQPYAPFWFVDELLEWTPGNDVDAIFNRSFTPLETKHFNAGFKSNAHARANEANVEVLPIFATTSGNPSQGSLSLSYYAFTYWQYCDLMVYWGGSSFEGIILTPTAPVVDAAHRHGVPVYGTVFFPPSVYGGKRDWVYQFVQNQDGIFPVADKLIEVANYYGFDGWFINQETGDKGKVQEDKSLANAMQEFMLYFKNNSDLSIQWYDAMLKDGTVKWQHEINDKNKMFFQKGDTLVSDQMFLDFRYTSKNLQTTKKAVEELGRNIYDVYGGVDVQNNGYEAETGYRYPQGANFDVLFPEGKPHAASLAFYVPSWTYSSSNNMDEFYKKEARFWVGEKGDPRDTQTDHNWKGVAHYVPAKSPINQIPFVTNFCTGQGGKFFLKGKDITSPTWKNGWNNLTLQDIQPTWRWIVKSKGTKLKVDYDFTDAYNGGNCLSISGKSEEDNIIPLYSTRLKLNKNSVATVAVKKNKESDVFLLLTFANGKEKELSIRDRKNAGEWYVDTLSLKKYIGWELQKIALKVAAKNAKIQNVKIGSIGIVDMQSDRIEAPTNIQLLKKAPGIEETINLRVKWDAHHKGIYYYRLYKINSDGSKYFLGATTSNACFLPSVSKTKNEKITIGVEAVGRCFSVSPVTIFNIEK
ncbi:endo-beta-N-acetylglucosaminidase [Saccharicrinis sp. 156]|uniref:endo-beta-N-acetylglucosaminidase n=1 Tax=Saccharicrinis sp. 156 TaxID=3417574 RepID=UPI003D329797